MPIKHWVAHSCHAVLALSMMLCGILDLACNHKEAPLQDVEVPRQEAGNDRIRPMPVDQAIRIALDTLKAKGWIIDDKEFDLTARRGEGQWSLWFVFKPWSPGNDVTVFVDDSGTVDVLPGF